MTPDSLLWYGINGALGLAAVACAVAYGIRKIRAALSEVPHA